MVQEKKDRLSCSGRLLGLFALFALSCAAQGQSRYGATPEDSAKCVQCLSLYQEFMKQNVLQDAYEPWRCAISVCPASSKGLYQNGTRLLLTFLSKEKAADRKARLIDSLYMVYDMRIEYFGEEAFVLGRKGVDMLQLSPERCQEAHDILKRSVDLGGERTEPGVLAAYYQSLHCLHTLGQATKDRMLKDYMRIMGIIESNLGNEGLSDTDRGYFTSARDNVNSLFFKVADCADIGRIVGDMLKDRSDDQEMNVRLLRVMNAKECTEEKVYIELAKKVHAVDPSSESAYGLGMYLLRRGDRAGAARYFKEAVDLCIGCADKVKYLTTAGQLAINAGNHAQARSHANQILQAEPKNGEAMILIGDAVSSQSGACDKPDAWGVYWLAYDYYQKAKSLDPGVAEKAADRMAKTMAHFPTQGEAFFHQLTDGQSFQTTCGGLNEGTTVRTRK